MVRLDILNQKEQILQWIEENLPKAEIARRLKCKIDTLNSYLIKMGIEYTGNKGRRGKSRTGESYISADHYFYKNSPIHSSQLRIKILKEGLKPHQCESCKLTQWLGKPIPLELEHIDGDHYNNQWENLKLLCPNCHQLTPTHSGKNEGNYLGN